MSFRLVFPLVWLRDVDSQREAALMGLVLLLVKDNLSPAILIV